VCLALRQRDAARLGWSLEWHAGGVVDDYEVRGDRLVADGLQAARWQAGVLVPDGMSIVRLGHALRVARDQTLMTSTAIGVSGGCSSISCASAAPSAA
jgi:hypothetical protein